ncbi:MAG: hypothetical protein II953_03680, partial [Clostridia bacterium]|nr:hypothetical protein [Clostridia bacterium]
MDVFRGELLLLFGPAEPDADVDVVSAALRPRIGIDGAADEVTAPAFSCPRNPYLVSVTRKAAVPSFSIRMKLFPGTSWAMS